MIDTPLPSVIAPVPAQRDELESQLFHEPATARRRWWTAFSVSKVGQLQSFLSTLANRQVTTERIPLPDHVTPDLVPTSNGFFLGSLSDQGFCRCLRRPSTVRNAVVRRVMWWRARKSPLHHQFIVLTVSHEGVPGDPPVLYDLRVERVGKGIGFHGLAEHKITSSLALPLANYTNANELMFGLLADDTSTLDGGEVGSFYTKSAFLDVLDEKWRGPPPRLWHIARYIEYIVALAPRYRLASTNCYYFARLLMYSIGLRHYSFSTLAAGDALALFVRSRRHDPSGISRLFRFLHEEEKSNGILLYARIKTFVQVSSALLLVGGVAAGAILVWKHRGSTPGVATLGGGMVGAFAIWATLVVTIDSRMIQRSRHALRGEVEALVAQLDSDTALTIPRGKRGDYKLPYYLVPEKRTEWQRPVGDSPGFAMEVTYMVEKRGPRDPVLPWDNPEQIYRPHVDIPPPAPRMPDSG